MKKYLLLAASFCLMLLLLVTPNTSMAKYVTPASFNCTASCNSWTYWDGPSYGGLVTAIADNPSINNKTGVWDRFLWTKQSSNSANASAYAGIEKCGQNCQGFCGHLTSNLHYFLTGRDTNGLFESTECFSVPSGDINNTITFHIRPYVSNGGGMLLSIENTTTGTSYYDYWSYANGAPSSFHRIQYQETINDTVNGHEVYGAPWLSSSYVSSNGSVYQTRGVDYLSARQPPQMYWDLNPAPGGSGGVMYSCIYDSGSYCQLRNRPSVK